MGAKKFSRGLKVFQNIKLLIFTKKKPKKTQKIGKNP
jgi:hypothetical protein